MTPCQQISISILPSRMESHVGNTFQKIARTLKGGLPLTEGDAVGGGCLDCEVNCEADPAYWIRKEQKGGKPISVFPQLNPTVACYCLLLQPLTRPSQNPVSART